MSHRAHASQILEDKDVGVFHATAPLLAMVFLLLLILLAGMGIIAALAWQNDAEVTTAAILLLLLFGSAILMRFLKLPELLPLTTASDARRPCARPVAGSGAAILDCRERVRLLRRP